MQETIKQYLEFRKRFTKREWFELNKNIEAQFAKKSRPTKIGRLRYSNYFRTFKKIYLETI